MPIKDLEKRKQYMKEWKERKRRSLGIPKKEPSTPEMKKEQAAKAQLKYRQKNKSSIAQKRQIYLDSKPKKRLVWSAKKRAKEQQIPFNITEDDIIIPEYCPYLGIKLCSSSRRGESRANIISLDKIRPELGYVKDNIEVISHLANTMKSNATEEQLIAFATEILRRYSNKTTT